MRLTENSWPFLKGTEFLSTNSDDGMWSRYAFDSGEVMVDGSSQHISVESDKLELILDRDYKGTVLVDPHYYTMKDDSEYQ